MIVIIIVFLFSIFMGYRYFEDKKETTSKDAVTFKKEYEALNNRVNPNNNKLYPEVSISMIILLSILVMMKYLKY